ncbi:MAG: DNA gyrase subunit A [Chloroflexota bacterium]
MDIGSINRIDINREMRSSYLDYAMSVIVARALPDARDGLKPVHRRILYAMYDMGLRPNTSHRKSARIVGEVLGKYHPHGDASVYNAMVRMAQQFAMRYPLVDGQGNFGSIDGDSPAAMRYTEARMASISSDLLVDIDRDTVNFSTNFDDSLTEPDVLPNRIPNLLVNGQTGIAVGMSTDIPPHNLGELCDAIIHMLDNFETVDEISVDDLMEFVKGPDFPTGALIVGTEGIKSAYATGKGKVIMRAVAEIEPNPNKPDRQRINITEIPFQVNKANLIERIAELVNKGIIEAISDLRDESDRRGISIVVELKRNAQPKKVLNQLYKHTALQSTFSIQMLALVNRYPRLLSLKRALQIFIDHRTDVITRRTEFELQKAKKRQHILEGLLKAIDNLDEIIDTIRKSPDADEARGNLMVNFDLTEVQATAILDMQLRRLAALERQKLEEEYKEVTGHIDYLESLLNDPVLMRGVIREEMVDVRDKYSDERRSKIVAGSGELRDEDLVEDIDILLAITQKGYIKRTPASTFKTQGRGGKGMIGMNTRSEDQLDQLLAARNHDTLLFFSNKGKAYSVKAYEVPEADRTARGTSLMNVLLMEQDERITAVLPVRNFEDAEFLLMATRKGRIKRVSLSQFVSVRSTGLRAIVLDDDDELVWVKMTNGNKDIVLVSQQGRGIRFKETDVRLMGRVAAGVNGIRLRGDDLLAGCAVIDSGLLAIDEDDEAEGADGEHGELTEEATGDSDVLILTEYGYGKRTPISRFRQQNRYGSGVRAMNLDPKRTGNIMSARQVSPGDEVTMITANGIIMRLSADEISRQGRYSQGVRVMEMKGEDDYVASVAVIRATSGEENENENENEEEEGAQGEENQAPSSESVEEETPPVDIASPSENAADKGEA